MRWFDLTDDLTYKLSQPQFKFSSHAGIPGRTSVWILDHLSGYFEELRGANCQVFDPSQYTTLLSMCRSFVNGAIGARHPNDAAWKHGYDNNPEMSLLREMVLMPSKMTKHIFRMSIVTIVGLCVNTLWSLKTTWLSFVSLCDRALIALRSCGLSPSLFEMLGHFNAHRMHVRLCM